MGSFTSAPKIPNEDTADDNIVWPDSMSWSDIGKRCEQELLGWPQNISRDIVTVSESGGDRIRLMQWNVLAQGKYRKWCIEIFFIQSVLIKCFIYGTVYQMTNR